MEISGQEINTYKPFYNDINIDLYLYVKSSHYVLFISDFALTKSHIVLRVSYFQLLPIQITPKFDVFSLTFALRLYLCSDTYGIGKNKPLDVF